MKKKNAVDSFEEQQTSLQIDIFERKMNDFLKSSEERQSDLKKNMGTKQPGHFKKKFK